MINIHLQMPANTVRGTKQLQHPPAIIPDVNTGSYLSQHLGFLVYGKLHVDGRVGQ